MNVTKYNGMELLGLDPNLKSLESSEARMLVILNATNIMVDICWINYNSQLNRIAKLRPLKITPLNTYTSHPFVFIDNSTGQLLHVNNQPVFFAKSLEREQREKVIIHLPMKSLQDTALLCLFKQLKDVDSVDELEIPENLKCDLKQIFLVHEKHKRRLHVQA